MSFSRDKIQTFFNPLAGKTATFLLDGREANMHFAQMVSTLVAERGEAMAILDLDAFYSSRADRIFSTGSNPSESTTIIVPKPGSDIETDFSHLFEARQEVLVIDSLNSFFHLISLDDWHARSRKLTFAIEALSHYAKTNSKAVILSMYRRERYAGTGTRRPISRLSDLTVSVTVRGAQVVLRTEKGSGWTGGEFSTRNL